MRWKTTSASLLCRACETWTTHDKRKRAGVGGEHDPGHRRDMVSCVWSARAQKKSRTCCPMGRMFRIGPSFRPHFGKSHKRCSSSLRASRASEVGHSHVLSIREKRPKEKDLCLECAWSFRAGTWLSAAARHDLHAENLRASRMLASRSMVFVCASTLRTQRRSIQMARHPGRQVGIFLR